MPSTASNLISDAQRRQIYGLAKQLGISKGSRDDELHALIYRETGRYGVSELSASQGQQLLQVLRSMTAKLKPQPAPKATKKEHPETPGGVTADQQRKIWRLMYRLRDANPSGVGLGDRLCAVIRKQIKVDCTPKDPFRFITFAQGWKLIEALKGIVASAEKGK